MKTRTLLTILLPVLIFCICLLVPLISNHANQSVEPVVAELQSGQEKTEQTELTLFQPLSSRLLLFSR